MPPWRRQRWTSRVGAAANGARHRRRQNDLDRREPWFPRRFRRAARRRRRYAPLTYQERSRPPTQGEISCKSAVHKREDTMSVARVTEITSSSPKSFDDALRVGLTRANKTLQN